MIIIINTRNYPNYTINGINTGFKSIFSCRERRLAVCSPRYCWTKVCWSPTVSCDVSEHLPGLNPIYLRQYHFDTYQKLGSQTSPSYIAHTTYKKVLFRATIFFMTIIKLLIEIFNTIKQLMHRKG